MKFDKEYVKKLAASLDIELDDALIALVEKNINEWYETDVMPKDMSQINPNYQKIKNCSQMKKDEPVKSSEDVLSGCKRADKYVVGK